MPFGSPYNAILRSEFVSTEAAMVNLPCPDIASHNLAPITKTFLCDNAVLHREPVPTEVAMVNSRN